MDEKRKAERLKDEKPITLTIVDVKKTPFEEKKIHSHGMDISVSGIRIHSHIFLPVDTLIIIKMTLKTLNEIISAVGKVIWIKAEDKPYEMGVEFLTPSRVLADYISWKQMS